VEQFMTMPKSKLAGWILSGLVALFLCGASATGKFIEWEGKAAAFEKLGFTTDVMFKIGLVEVFISLLFLVPRAAFVAAILLTGYLGGATVTHVRVGEAFAMPVIIGVLVWVALGLRQPAIFTLALGKSPGGEAPGGRQ
jgi:hypothetical protein